MRVAIIGSREFTNYEHLKTKMEELDLNITEVVSGQARGADTLGVRWAQEKGIPFTEFPAEWDNLNAEGAVIKTNKYGKEYNANAGFQRNKDIVNNADIVVSFWDMKSKGTKDSLKYAHSLKKRWIIIDICKYL
jgi:hypothetical protein